MSEVRPTQPERPLDPLDPSATDLRLLAGQLLQGLQRSVDGAAASGLGGASTFPEALYRMRRARDELFPGFFADASWDMLLDLYEQRRRGRSVTISSACLASAVPPTTALRHLDLLTEQGLVVRRPCPHDARSTYVELSDRGVAMLDAWVMSALRTLLRWASDACPDLVAGQADAALFPWQAGQDRDGQA